MESFEFLKLVPLQSSSEVPKDLAWKTVLQIPSTLPLRVGPDESLQKASGGMSQRLCSVAKVGIQAPPRPYRSSVAQDLGMQRRRRRAHSVWESKRN